MLLMELHMDESSILDYADQYEDDDSSIENLVKKVKKRRYLKKSELLTLSNWIARNTNTRLIEKNSDSVVEEMTKLSLAAETEEDRIKYLYRLDGVALSVASAILHWFHNDDYPIYSKPALETLGVEKKHCKPPFDDWWCYVTFCRRIKEENDIEDMRTLDRALWQYSRTPTVT